DALVVALTNRRRLGELSKIVKRGGAKGHGEIVAEPWPTIRDDVAERLAQINVSHRVERKVRGALHEETLYGPTSKPGEWVVRKPLDTLSPNEIERIRDDFIRQLVHQNLEQAGLEVGRGRK